jgi:uncharacterized protein
MLPDVRTSANHGARPNPAAVKARLHQARAALAPQLTPLIATPEETAVTATDNSPAWADVSVTEIRCRNAGEAGRVHVMVLQERTGSRQLPMWIGPAEATALALSLEAVETPRPLTYQMAASLLGAAGSRVTEVRITRLTAPVFYAVIAVDGPAGRREIDARPSDAVNLALVTGAPVRVDSALLDDMEAQAEHHPQWRELPIGTAEIAAAERQRTAQALWQPHS